MKYIAFIFSATLLLACSQTEEVDKKEPVAEKTDNRESKPVERKDLIEIKDNTYIEYYDAKKKQIKQTGDYDEDGKRHGVWTYYHPNGIKGSTSSYTNGMRNGVSQVWRPNGSPYYIGEYRNDKKIGVWRTYDEQGKFVSEKDYGKE